MPIHYWAYTSWLELYCREGFRFAWSSIDWDYEEEEKEILELEAYYPMTEVFDNFGEFCIQTDESRMLSIFGVLMLLGATVTYIIRELRFTLFWDLIANRKVS